jgi:hypothetical protein
MSLYEELGRIDFVTPIVGRLPIEVTSDGNPIVFLRGRLEPKSLWIIHKPIKDERTCDLWHDVYWDFYRFIPKSCLSCWKIVMEIPTVRQLMKIMEDQSKETENLCKCGVEVRAFTGKLGKYMAFWYGHMTKGLEGGRELHRRIQQQYPGVKIILKRGCTEFSNEYPQTDQWDELYMNRGWGRIEAELEKIFVVEYVDVRSTPNLMRPRILRGWIDWAYEHEDETYLDFVDGPPFHKTVTYHSSEHKNEVYPGDPVQPRKMQGRLTYEEIKDNNRSEGESTREEAESSRLTLLS